MPTGLIALAIGLGVLVLIVVVSFAGPRDRGGRLPGNSGSMFPGPDGDGGDFGGDG